MTPPSLHTRALTLLAQREHSRSELRRKLLRSVRGGVEGEDTSAPDVDTLLDELAARGYLSEARFVESRVRLRAERFGLRRIQQELAQHGLALDDAQRAELHETELARAREVWQRKFGAEPPADAAARARQMRFLSARGFSTGTLSRLLRDTGGA